MPVETLLSDQEAAEYLKLKPQTLRVWRATNRHPELRYCRIGNRIRYRLTDLEKFVAKNMVGSK